MSSQPNEVQNNYIKWAVQAISSALEEYENFDDYYQGKHELAFATDKWTDAFGTEFEEFADNWCQIVVDTAAQRLEILGWDSDDKKSAKAAEEIWERNRGELEADEVHTQSFVKGDSYIVCWPDPKAEGKEAQFFYNDATEVTAFYDPANRRRIERAAKRYTGLDGSVHLYLYFATHTEHYIVPSSTTPDQVAAFSAGLLPVGDMPGGFVKAEPDILNTFDKVPVFHFKNRALGSTHGTSELNIVIPIQNAINKLLMDMMVGSEFGSFRQKAVASAGQPKDGFRSGGDRVWATTDSSAKFFEFGQIDLEPMFKAVETLVGHVAKITQTPMHYLRTSGDMPSGEALKTAESGLVKKVEARQKTWGRAWSDMMSFAVEIETGSRPTSRIKPKWRSAETRHDLEQAQTAQLKSVLGIPLEQLWAEHFNYEEEEIANFKKENKAIAASVLAAVIAQAGQLPPGSEAVTNSPQQLLELIQTAINNGALREGEGTADITQILALLPKSITSRSTAGEATTRPQPNTTPPASPTRRSVGFKD